MATDKIIKLSEQKDTLESQHAELKTNERQLQQKLDSMKLVRQLVRQQKNEKEDLEGETKALKEMIFKEKDRFDALKVDHQDQKIHLQHDKEKTSRRLKSLKEIETLIRTEAYLNIKRQNILRDKLKVFTVYRNDKTKNLHELKDLEEALAKFVERIRGMLDAIT